MEEQSESEKLIEELTRDNKEYVSPKELQDLLETLTHEMRERRVSVDSQLRNHGEMLGRLMDDFNGFLKEVHDIKTNTDQIAPIAAFILTVEHGRLKLCRGAKTMRNFILFIATPIGALGVAIEYWPSIRTFVLSFL